MNKYEFLNELKVYLSERLPAEQVSYHVQYYRDYIEREISGGRTEAEVLAELGEPRIVGKTVIDAAKFSGSAYKESYREPSYSQSSGSAPHQDNHARGCFFDTSTVWGKIKLGALIIMILAIVVVIVRFAVGLLMYILPAIIVIALISAVINRRK